MLTGSEVDLSHSNTSDTDTKIDNTNTSIWHYITNFTIPTEVKVFNYNSWIIGTFKSLDTVINEQGNKVYAVYIEQASGESFHLEEYQWHLIQFTENTRWDDQDSDNDDENGDNKTEY